MRQEKALALGEEPEKGPDVTQVSSPSSLAIYYLSFLTQFRSLCNCKEH